MDNGYNELAIASEHAVSIDVLPNLHKDPFDRLLVAQAMVEGVTLLTSDDKVFAYFGHGTIDCGPGNDVLTLSKSSEHNYTYLNCESVVIGYP